MWSPPGPLHCYYSITDTSHPWRGQAVNPGGLSLVPGWGCSAGGTGPTKGRRCWFGVCGPLREVRKVRSVSPDRPFAWESGWRFGWAAPWEGWGLRTSPGRGELCRPGDGASEDREVDEQWFYVDSLSTLRERNRNTRHFFKSLIWT